MPGLLVGRSFLFPSGRCRKKVLLTRRSVLRSPPFQLTPSFLPPPASDDDPAFTQGGLLFTSLTQELSSFLANEFFEVC